jgi:hypothetical protein
VQKLIDTLTLEQIEILNKFRREAFESVFNFSILSRFVKEESNLNTKPNCYLQRKITMTNEIETPHLPLPSTNSKPKH